MQLFYANSFELKAGILSPEESLHCIKVLRKINGDNIHVINGLGDLFLCEISDANPKKCAYKIISQKNQKNNLPPLHIAISPTKNIDRTEFFIEKACEIGIQSITPLLTFNSERKHLNEERLNKILVSACKQSYTLNFPILNPASKFTDIVKLKVDQKLIAHCFSHETPHLKDFNTQKNTLLLIGPEGDFSEQEIKLATENGFESVSLGEKRLRTETAGILACSIFNLID
jgi:16S rRNA (uracil1498-N3)-methyltransferase